MLVRTYRPQPFQHQLHKGKLQKQNLINKWEKRIIRKMEGRNGYKKILFLLMKINENKILQPSTK